MRYISLFVLFLFLGVLASAQKVHFCDTSNKWTIYQFDPDHAIGMYLESYKNDTIISGVSYHKLNIAHSFVREDTMLQKVYAIKNGDTSLTEQLLYDYSLHIGDTFRCREAVHHVSGIDSVVINGVWHRVWSFAIDTCMGCGVGFMGSGYTVIEGIGSINETTTPLFPLYFEVGSVLTCFKNRGIQPPLSHKVGSYFDNTSSCTSTYGLVVQNVAAGIRGISLIPNPATTTITVTADPDQYHTVIICNSIGQQLSQNNLNMPETVINVAGLPQGIYYVVLQGDGQREVMRFVKI